MINTLLKPANLHYKNEKCGLSILGSRKGAKGKNT